MKLRNSAFRSITVAIFIAAAAAIAALGSGASGYKVFDSVQEFFGVAPSTPIIKPQNASTGTRTVEPLEPMFFGTTVSYTGMGSVTCPAVPTATISPSVSGLTFSQLSRGSGVTCISASTGIAGSAFNNSLASGLSGNKWFTLSITSDASTTFTVDSLSVVSQVSTAAGGNAVDIQYSIGAGSKTSVGSFTPTATSTAYPITPSSTISVGAGQTLNIFFVPNNLSASGTTCRINNSTSITVTTTPVSTNHTVTFDANGGTGSMSAQVASTSTPLTSNAFTRTGYSFAGWNTAANGSGTAYANGANYSFSTDATLYAQWTANSYSVTYDGNTNTGGSAPAVQNGNYNTSITLAGAGTLTKTGYTFAGWNTASDGSGTNYAGGASFTVPATNTTLYAKWTINNYSVAYDGNANDGGSAPATQNGDYNTSVTLAGAGTLTKTGYTFAGWNTAADGSGTAHAGGSSFTIPAGNTTLYAQWTANNYSIAYDGNTNDGGSAPATQNGDYNTSVTLSGAGTLTKTGYSFAGWNTAADGSGTAHAGGSSFTVPAGNTTLFAQWSINSYTVSFDSNGGSAVSSQSVTYNTTATAPANPTKTGHTFAGWYSDAGLTAAFSFATAITADTTIYAKWTPIPYTLTYTAGTGGTLSGTSPQTVDYGSSGSAVTAVPDSGYAFVDWSDGSTANPRTDNPVTGNVTVTANFANTACSTLTLPTTTAVTDTDVDIPITITDTTNKGIISVDFNFTYDPLVAAPVFLTGTQVSATLGTVTSGDALVFANQTEAGKIKVSIFGSNALSGAGTLVTIHMHAVGAGGTSTALTFVPSTVLLNGSLVCSGSVDGSLSVTNASTVTSVATSGSPSTYGDSVTFTATTTSSAVGVTEGNITFIEGGTCAVPTTVLQAAALVNGSGQVLFTTSALSASTHTITACYGGATGLTPSSGSVSQVVNQAASVTAISCPTSVVYDGTVKTPCSVSVTGAGGLNLTPTPAYSDNTIVGTATASYTYGGDANHTGSSDSKTFAITKATTTTTLTFEAGPYTYRGTAFTASASVSGVGSQAFTASVPVVYSGDCTNVTSSNGCTATATYAGDDNHTGSSDTKSITITQAESVTAVSCPVSVVYNGSAQTPCTVSVTGAGGLNLTPTPTYSGNTIVGTATASYTYAGDVNYSGSSDSKTFAITQATTTTVVTCPASVVYNGSAQTPCTVSVTGAGGLSLTPSAVYLDNTNVGTATASYTYAGDSNYAGSSDSKTFAITQAASTTVISCGVGTFTYTGSAIEPCTATVTGAGGLNTTVAVTYGSNVNVGTATADAIYSGDANHSGSTATQATFEITKASSTTTVSCPVSVVYDGSAQTPCTVSVTGAGLSISPPASYADNTVVGTATASYTFAGDANHTGSSDSKTFDITPAASVTTISCPVSVVYNGSAQTPCTVSVTGAGGLNLTPSADYLGNTIVGTATASYTFTGDANHTGSSDSKTFAITKATTTTTLTFEAGPYTYRGTAFTATASVTGVGSQTFTASVPVDYSGDCTNVTSSNGCTATATYAGDDNHTGSSDTKSITITQAASTTVISCGVGTFTYTGSAIEPCTATVTGAGGLNTTVAVTYGSNVNVGTATANASFGGDTNHSGSSATQATFAITKANAVCTVTGYTVTYDALPHTATGSCVGVLSEGLVGLDLSGTTHTAPGTYNDSWTFTDVTGNYNDTSGSVTDTISTGIVNGSVTYAVVSKPVPNVTFNGVGSLAVTGSTDSLGAYSLTNFGAGSYTITPSKTAQNCVPSSPNGIMANDAAMVSQHVVNLITLNSAQLAAAKVSGILTPTLSSFDAALIAQKVVGICSGSNLAGQWKFSPASSTHASVTGTITDDYSAYMMGDVSGDWNPSGGSLAEMSLNPGPDAVAASVPSMAGAPGSQVTVPFRIGNLQGKSVGSYQFDIEYDPAVVAPDQVAATLAGTMSNGLSVVSNAPRPGLLKVAVYGALPVSGDGVYVNLKFSVLGGLGSTTPLRIRGFVINDGSDEVTGVDGQLTVSSTASSGAIRGQLLTAGGTPIGKVSVVVTGTNGESRSLLSSPFGYFEFGGLSMGETYTVSVQSKRYTFTPRSVSMTGSVVELDMVADQ